VTQAAPLRVALIGAGRMGGHHARVLGSVEGARLVGVHDKHAERAAALAAQHGCSVFARLEDIVPACDAAIVAASSPAHLAVGRALLDAGIPCLIEKPLATTEADSLELIATAARRATVLAVGHSERFNPATVALLAALDGWQVHAIEARRFNPGSTRIADTGVVSDLMVHDLDIVLRVMGSAPIELAATGIMHDPQAGADHAVALLSFGAAALASCAASRITAHRVRELALMGDRGTLLVDYLARTVTRIAPGGEPVPIAVAQADALATEQAAFVDTVRGSGPRRGQSVSGAEALAALRVAWAIERRIAPPIAAP
jgi:predicted dehydrogenase